jgi:hypothetical protein
MRRIPDTAPVCESFFQRVSSETETIQCIPISFLLGGDLIKKSAQLIVTLLIAGSPLSAVAQDSPRTIGKVLLVDNDKTIEMKYSVARHRGTSSAVKGVFATDKDYSVLSGAQALLRTTNPLPIFDFYADAGLNIQDSIYVIRYDRESDRRQVRVAIAKGGKVRTGVPKDRRPDTLLENLGDGPNSTTHYRLKPSIALSPGEYCLVRSAESCFDFGVDPK